MSKTKDWLMQQPWWEEGCSLKDSMIEYSNDKTQYESRNRDSKSK